MDYFFNIKCHTYAIPIIPICSLALQQTLPTFPTGVAGQIKFLNLNTNEVILNIDGGRDTPVQPFKVHGVHMNINHNSFTVNNSQAKVNKNAITQ